MGSTRNQRSAIQRESAPLTASCLTDRSQHSGTIWPKQCLVVCRVDVSKRLAPLCGLSRLSHFLSVRRSVVSSSTATDQFVSPPHHQIPRCGIVAHLSPQPRRQEAAPWHHLPRRHPFRKQRCAMARAFPVQGSDNMHIYARNKEPSHAGCGYCLCCPS